MEYFYNTMLEDYDIWREKEMMNDFDEELEREDEEELDEIEESEEDLSEI